LNQAPTPTEFKPSLACVEIHCESKFDCKRYPVNAVPMEPRNATAPVTHVMARLPRQAAMKNLPHRWITMVKKNSSMLHRCRLLTKCPSGEAWYPCGPSRASTAPLTRTTTSAARVATPNT
jgi:hypothetical protein